jgi:hypothetical protein
MKISDFKNKEESQEVVSEKWILPRSDPRTDRARLLSGKLFGKIGYPENIFRQCEF